MQHGKGSLTYPTGEEYVGFFKFGKRHGLGKLLYNDGTYREGIYKNDIFQEK